MYVPQVVWPLQALVLPFTFEAHMDIVVLGDIETGRVVESRADGVATSQVQLIIYHEAMKLNGTQDYAPL